MTNKFLAWQLRDDTSVWCDLILEELWRCGLKHVCLAPGSRSAPLALALERHGQFIVHTHYDERGLGFLALGLARESYAPVAIVTTSGTAVANLSPALHEARESGASLLVLSADRPPELLGCGANQTLSQPGIFGEAAARTFSLPSPDHNLPLRWLLNVVDEAMATIVNSDHSVVHINVALREPLYGATAKNDNSQWLKPITCWFNSDKPLCQWIVKTGGCVDVPNITEKRVVILAGQLRAQERDEVMALAERRGWLLIADSQSGLHGQPQVLACADMSLLSPMVHKKLCQTEKVLQFGRRLLSKSVNQWLTTWQEESNGEHWCIDERSDRHDPNFTVTRRISMRITDFCRQQSHQGQPVANETREWLAEALACGQEVASLLDQALASMQPPVFEIDAVRQFREVLEKHGNCQIFLGNSMPIRYFDALTTVKHNTDLIPVWANRGISGIDGLLATACGHAALSDRRTVMLIGDLSLLHDLNSLALVANYKLIVVLLNNSGGTIFNLFPVAQPILSKNFRIDHNWQSAGVAHMFGLYYRQPKTPEQYQVALQNALAQDQGAVIELLLPPSAATEAFASLKQMAREFGTVIDHGDYAHG